MIDKETGNYPTVCIYVNTRKKDSRPLPPLAFAFAATFPLWHVSVYDTTTNPPLHRSPVSRRNGIRVFAAEIYANEITEACILLAVVVPPTSLPPKRNAIYMCRIFLMQFHRPTSYSLSRFLAKRCSILDPTRF